MSEKTLLLIASLAVGVSIISGQILLRRSNVSLPVSFPEASPQSAIAPLSAYPSLDGISSGKADGLTEKLLEDINSQKSGGGAPAAKNKPSPLAPNLVIPSIDDIIPKFVPAPDKKNELPLPTVQDTELTIDATGATDLLDFLEYEALHSRELAVDYRKISGKLQAVVQEYNAVPSSVSIIERALGQAISQNARDYLHSLRDIALAKTKFERTVKVAYGGIGAVKTLIGFERLTVELVDKFDEYSSGSLSRKEFEDYFARYKNTAADYGSGFLRETGLLSQKKDTTLGDRILSFLGLKQVAYAISPGFGGIMISFGNVCPCSLGIMIEVGPPAPAYVELGVGSIIYPFEDVTPGRWLLGNFIPGPSCWQFAVDSCFPTVGEGRVLLIGTSA